MQGCLYSHPIIPMAGLITTAGVGISEAGVGTYRFMTLGIHGIGVGGRRGHGAHPGIGVGDLHGHGVRLGVGDLHGDGDPAGVDRSVQAGVDILQWQVGVLMEIGLSVPAQDGHQVITDPAWEVVIPVLLIPDSAIQEA